MQWETKVGMLRDRLPSPRLVLKLLLGALVEMQQLGSDWDARQCLRNVINSPESMDLSEPEKEKLELWAWATFLDERLRRLGGNERCSCAAPPQDDAEEADDDGGEAAAAAAAPSGAACGGYGLEGVDSIALRPCAWTREGTHIV